MGEMTISKDAIMNAMEELSAEKAAGTTTEPAPEATSEVKASTKAKNPKIQAGKTQKVKAPKAPKVKAAKEPKAPKVPKPEKAPKVFLEFKNEKQTVTTKSGRNILVEGQSQKEGVGAFTIEIDGNGNMTVDAKGWTVTVSQ